MDGNPRCRPPLKARHPNWKEKLRLNCLKRVQEDRTHLLWKVRLAGQQDQNQKEIVKSAFRGIVSNELKKIKQLSSNDQKGISKPSSDDVLWEYDGPQMDSLSTENESEELLIEMERLLYEDLKEELIRRELDAYEEEDEYLAREVFVHMQLNDDQAGKNDRIWCPICKRGHLLENHQLIYCTGCKLRLDLENDKVNLDFLRDRLGEVLEEHLDRGCILEEHLDRGCKATPEFSMETGFNLTALYIKCRVCDSFEIVL